MSLIAALALQDAGHHSHANQVGETIGCHFGHDIGAVNFDRTRADFEVECNDLVGLAGNQSFEHLTLAVRQRRQPIVDIGDLGFMSGCTRAFVESGTHR